MKEIKNALKEKGIRAVGYKKVGNVVIADTNLGKIYFDCSEVIVK